MLLLLHVCFFGGVGGSHRGGFWHISLCFVYVHTMLYAMRYVLRRVRFCMRLCGGVLGVRLPNQFSLCVWWLCFVPFSLPPHTHSPMMSALRIFVYIYMYTHSLCTHACTQHKFSQPRLPPTASVTTTNIRAFLRRTSTTTSVISRKTARCTVKCAVRVSCTFHSARHEFECACAHISRAHNPLV